MANGINNRGAACCQYAPMTVGSSAPGVNVNGGTVNVGGVNVPRTVKGFLQRIGEAFDAAVHGGDSGITGLPITTGRTYSGGANVIPFPMVNPYKPVIATGAPVTALTAFPKRFTQEVASTGSEPDDEQSSFDGLSGLGYSWADFGASLQNPLTSAASGPSKLQTILGTIQATLPATIQAIRAQPGNIFPGASYNPYAAGYPAGVYQDTASPTGRAAEDVGAGVGRAADTLGQTVSRFVTEHPYLVIGGGAALALLFMNPPRRR